MSLLSPMALAWAAVALPIIGLYILRIRRRRQIVPTLLFWDQIFQDTAPRSLWRRLRHWLSLLLQLALLTLLVLALADPVSTGRSSKPVHYVLVIDQSASMKATDGAPARIDEARERAMRLVNGMRSQDEATIIGAGVMPTVLSGRTQHQPMLRAALRDVHAADTTADLNAAVRLARSLTGAQGEPEVLLISDASGLATLDADLTGEIATHACGRVTNNIAITGLAVRPRSDNPLELQGILRVGNYTDAAVAAEVKLTLNDNLFDVAIVELAAGEEKVHAFRTLNSEGGVIRAKLTKLDALASDNVASAILPDVGRRKVTLVSTGDLFLESVLRSHLWMEVMRITPEEYAKSPPMSDILVFDGFVPEPLPNAPSLYVYPTRSSRLWTLGAEINNPIVSDLPDDESKLLRHVNLKNCTFHRARIIQADSAGNPLITSSGRPLLVHWPDARAPVVLLAINTRAGESDLPWRTAFPILMQNILNDLAGSTEDSLSAHRTSESVALPLPAATLTVTDETHRMIPVSATDLGATIGPVSTVSVVTATSGNATRRIAFNLADSRESNLRPPPTTQPSREANLALGNSGLSWPWWVVLVALAILLSAVEWSLHQRSVID